MSVSTRVGTALAAGYMLGRFKKLRLALVVASAMSNKNVRDSGLGLLSQGTKGLTASPEVQKLSKQITSQLVEAGKAAAITAASSRIDRLSDSLNERGATLLGDESDEEPEDDEPEDEYEGDEEDEEEPEDEYEDEGDEEEEEPEDEYDEEPEDEYEDEGEEEDEEPEDEYEDESDEEESEDEPEDEYEDEEESEEEPEEEPEEKPRKRSSGSKQRSTRRRRSASPAGRR